ncbi:YlxR family protein [Synechococcus sp. CC9616]|uniref:YlxR family protein n=1 Tax=Synechococcus sp. CC9616 TaxID=110663 RepID=UPI000490EAE1|nr:YlxR family protein [Synechococcus sp. CC9616]
MNDRPILRRCVACRQLLDRRLLWRVVRDYRDGVLLEEGMGRSAYLCPKEACLEDARRRKRLQKALRCQVPDAVLATMQKRLSSTTRESAEAN